MTNDEKDREDDDWANGPNWNVDLGEFGFGLCQNRSFEVGFLGQNRAMMLRFFKVLLILAFDFMGFPICFGNEIKRENDYYC